MSKFVPSPSLSLSYDPCSPYPHLSYPSRKPFRRSVPRLQDQDLLQSAIRDFLDSESGLGNPFLKSATVLDLSKADPQADNRFLPGFFHQRLPDLFPSFSSLLGFQKEAAPPSPLFNKKPPSSRPFAPGSGKDPGHGTPGAPAAPGAHQLPFDPLLNLNPAKRLPSSTGGSPSHPSSPGSSQSATAPGQPLSGQSGQPAVPNVLVPFQNLLAHDPSVQPASSAKTPASTAPASPSPHPSPAAPVDTLPFAEEVPGSPTGSTPFSGSRWPAEYKPLDQLVAAKRQSGIQVPHSGQPPIDPSSPQTSPAGFDPVGRAAWKVVIESNPGPYGFDTSNYLLGIIRTNIYKTLHHQKLQEKQTRRQNDPNIPPKQLERLSPQERQALDQEVLHTTQSLIADAYRLTEAELKSQYAQSGQKVPSADVARQFSHRYIDNLRYLAKERGFDLTEIESILREAYGLKVDSPASWRRAHLGDAVRLYYDSLALGRALADHLRYGSRAELTPDTPGAFLSQHVRPIEYHSRWLQRARDWRRAAFAAQEHLGQDPGRLNTTVYPLRYLAGEAAYHVLNPMEWPFVLFTRPVGAALSAVAANLPDTAFTRALRQVPYAFDVSVYNPLMLPTPFLGFHPAVQTVRTYLQQRYSPRVTGSIHPNPLDPLQHRWAFYGQGTKAQRGINQLRDWTLSLALGNMGAPSGIMSALMTLPLIYSIMGSAESPHSAMLLTLPSDYEPKDLSVFERLRLDSLRFAQRMANLVPYPVAHDAFVGRFAHMIWVNPFLNADRLVDPKYWSTAAYLPVNLWRVFTGSLELIRKNERIYGSAAIVHANEMLAKFLSQEHEKRILADLQRAPQQQHPTQQVLGFYRRVPERYLDLVYAPDNPDSTSGGIFFPTRDERQRAIEGLARELRHYYTARLNAYQGEVNQWRNLNEDDINRMSEEEITNNLRGIRDRLRREEESVGEFLDYLKKRALEGADESFKFSTSPVSPGSRSNAVGPPVDDQGRPIPLEDATVYFMAKLATPVANLTALYDDRRKQYLVLQTTEANYALNKWVEAVQNNNLQEADRWRVAAAYILSRDFRTDELLGVAADLLQDRDTMLVLAREALPQMAFRRALSNNRASFEDLDRLDLSQKRKLLQDFRDELNRMYGYLDRFSDPNQQNQLSDLERAVLSGVMREKVDDFASSLLRTWLTYNLQFSHSDVYGHIVPRMSADRSLSQGELALQNRFRDQFGKLAQGVQYFAYDSVGQPGLPSVSELLNNPKKLEESITELWARERKRTLDQIQQSIPQIPLGVPPVTGMGKGGSWRKAAASRSLPSVLALPVSLEAALCQLCPSALLGGKRSWYQVVQHFTGPQTIQSLFKSAQDGSAVPPGSVLDRDFSQSGAQRLRAIIGGQSKDNPNSTAPKPGGGPNPPLPPTSGQPVVPPVSVPGQGSPSSAPTTTPPATAADPSRSAKPTTTTPAPTTTRTDNRSSGPSGSGTSPAVAPPPRPFPFSDLQYVIAGLPPNLTGPMLMGWHFVQDARQKVDGSSPERLTEGHPELGSGTGQRPDQAKDKAPGKSVSSLDEFLASWPEDRRQKFQKWQGTLDAVVSQAQKELRQNGSISEQTAQQLSAVFREAQAFDREFLQAGMKLPTVQDFPQFLRTTSQSIKAAVEAGDLNQARTQLAFAGLVAFQNLRSNETFRNQLLQQVKNAYIQSGRPEAEAEEAAKSLLDNLGPAQMYMLAGSLTFDDRSSMLLANTLGLAATGLGTAGAVNQEVQAWLAVIRSFRERATRLMDAQIPGLSRFAPEFWRRMDGTDRMLFLAGGGLVMIGLLQSLFGSSSLLGLLVGLLGGGMMMYGYTGGNILGFLTGSWPGSAPTGEIPIGSRESGGSLRVPDFWALISPEVRRTGQDVKKVTESVQSLSPQQKAQVHQGFNALIEELLAGTFQTVTPTQIQVDRKALAQRLTNWSSPEKSSALLERMFGLTRDQQGRLQRPGDAKVAKTFQELANLDSNALFSVFQTYDVPSLLGSLEKRQIRLLSDQDPAMRAHIVLLLREIQGMVRSSDPEQKKAVRDFFESLRVSAAKLAQELNSSGQPVSPRQ